MKRRRKKKKKKKKKRKEREGVNSEAERTIGRADGAWRGKVEDNRRESGSGGGSRGKPTPPSCQVDNPPS